MTQFKTWLSRRPCSPGTLLWSAFGAVFGMSGGVFYSSGSVKKAIFAAIVATSSYLLAWIFWDRRADKC